MTLKVKRLRKYHPRRSAKHMRAQREKLRHLELFIAEDIGHLFSSLKHGSDLEIQCASEKTRKDLLHIGPDMEKIAYDIGAPFPKKVRTFLLSIEMVSQPPTQRETPWRLWADDRKIFSCNRAKEELEKALAA